MTDNYQDEMREALELGREYAKGALAAHDAAYQGHSATEAERVMIVDDIAKLDAALSRLSAQDETAGDAPWNARDTEALRVNAEQKRKIAELEARLSASGQECDKCEYKTRAKKAEIAQVERAASGQGEWRVSEHLAAIRLALETVEEERYRAGYDWRDVVQARDNLDRLAELLGAAPAPEKGEAKE